MVTDNENVSKRLLPDSGVTNTKKWRQVRYYLDKPRILSVKQTNFKRKSSSRPIRRTIHILRYKKTCFAPQGLPPFFRKRSEKNFMDKERPTSSIIFDYHLQSFQLSSCCLSFYITLLQTIRFNWEWFFIFLLIPQLED